MEELALNEFRRQVSEYINQTYYANKSFTLTKGGKKVAVLLPMAAFARLQELEAWHSYMASKEQESIQPASTNEE